MAMKGGKLIGTGSGSCVFQPNFPCKEGDNIDLDHISKVIYRKEAEKYVQHEKKMNEKIKKIKGHRNWALTYNSYCDAPPLNIMKEYDENGVRKCIGQTSYKTVDSFNFHSYMMNGEYGGIELEDFFEENYSNISRHELDLLFLDLMKKMKSLFTGIKNMNKHNISHNDIKPGNIVLDGDNLKFIDFGLSGMMTDKNHFKGRSNREFNTSRLYIYYPLDYILFYAKHKELDEEVEYIYKKQYRYHFNDFTDIYKMFGYDSVNIFQMIINDIKNKNIKENDMIKGIDVYSLGILVPLLFLFYSNIPHPYEDSSMITDFYKLFKDMTHPLPYKRININQADLEFSKLLRMYTKKSSRKKTKKKSKPSKKKKKKK